MAIDIRLVNMPFWQSSMPALSLIQLKSRAADVLRAETAIKIEYVNHDFARWLGAKYYDHIALNGNLLQSGFGDWLFRRIAFPDMPDNTASYSRRYRRAIGAELFDAALDDGPLSSDRLQAQLEEIISERKLDVADVVGFTSTFAQTVPSLAMARLLRKRRPDQVLVMGGANCEGEMGEALARVTRDLDFIFSGPALVSLPAFLRQIASGRLAEEPIRGVLPCASSRKSRSQPVGIPAVAFGQELPIETPLALDYDDFIVSYEQLPGEKRPPNLSFETSRGCWWGQKAHCTFCGLNGETMAYRAMPPSMARALMEGLFDRYGDSVKHYNAVDNIMPKEYVRELFENLRPPAGVEIFYETKADLTDAHVKTLASAAVTRIQPGIESLLTSTLKLMRKGTTAFHNIRLLMSCVRHDVTPEWNLLVGFPGETPDTFDIYERLLPNLFHLYPPSGAYSVRFDRFSPYFKNAGDYDLELEPANYYRFCYHYPGDTISRIAYYFQNVNINSSYYEAMAEGLGKIERLAAEWNRRWFEAGARKPQLALETTAGGAIVRDGRGPEVKEILLDHRHIEVLRACREVVDLSAARSDERAYEALKMWGLLFEERGRVLSLVDLEMDARPELARRQALTSTAH
jgi:ribosomal peptide maturation radical SAM protein 1